MVTETPRDSAMGEVFILCLSDFLQGPVELDPSKDSQILTSLRLLHVDMPTPWTPCHSQFRASSQGIPAHLGFCLCRETSAERSKLLG